MESERLKVLEMVADGKITPEEGVRLLEALGQPHAARAFCLGMPDVRLPKVDLGHLGELCVELRDSVVEGARRAHGQFRRSRAGQWLDYKDFPLSVDVPEGVDRCHLKLETRAGGLKVRGGDTEGKLLVGKVKHAPEEPTVLMEVREGIVEVGVKHSAGRASLRANPAYTYAIAIDNAAADTEVAAEDLSVDDISVNNNAGSVRVRLGGNVAHVSVGIQSNAGSVMLRVPETHAVKVTPTGSLSTHNLEKYGLAVVDGVAKSSDYDANENRVDVVLHQNVASFALDWKRRDGVEVGKEEPKPGEDE